MTDPRVSAALNNAAKARADGRNRDARNALRDAVTHTPADDMPDPDQLNPDQLAALIRDHQTGA